jgi:hypothetical protein
VQVLAAHTPLQQLKSQQSWFEAQEPAVGMHAPHLPPMHRLEVEQQSVSAVQVWPVVAQHLLPTQPLPLQQVAWVLQAPPSPVHGVQVPLLQMLEQHWLARVQVRLSALQLPQTLL